MAGEVEAMGAFTTAGLAASTLDGPGSHPAKRGAKARPIGGARDFHADPHDIAHGACANCATPLTGNFCHACGQSAHVHRSVGHIFEEFLHGIWHFDSKAWRTLPRLVFRPGTLTRDYVYGKRAGYIAPLALFLFSIFLMFFVFGLVGGPDINKFANAASANDTVAEAQSDYDDARGEVTGAATDLAEAKADRDTTPDELAGFAAALAAKRTALDGAQAKLAAERKSAAAAIKAAAPLRTWQDRLSEAARNGELKINTGSAEVDANVRKALLNPDFALYRIEQKAYKLSFLLVPLSLPTLWLMFFWRRDVHTYDHVVFALYSLSFMSLLLIVGAVGSKLSSTLGVSLGIGGWLVLAPMVHMYAQLHGAYRLGWFGALWRTFVLGIASLVTLGMFAALIVVAGLAD